MRTLHDSTARPADVLRLAWPILVSMASYASMSIVDSIFVARLGTNELASVGLASSALYLCTALWVGALAAVRIQVAQASGAGRPARAREAAWHGVWLALVASLSTWLCLPFATVLLAAVGASEEVAAHGLGYLLVRLSGSPIVYLVLVLQGWFQGREDTRTPMVAVLVGNAVNIALDPVLIHGGAGLPALGVTGAGIATLLAWIAQLVVLVGRVGPMRPVAPRVAAMRRMVHIGAPLGGHHALDIVAHAVFSAMLAGVGEAHVAAHVVVVRVLMTSFLPGHAVGQATGVLVGRSLGAGRPALAREAWRSGTLVATGLMAAMGILFVALPRWWVVPFGVTPDVLERVVQVLVLAGLVQVFDAIGMVALGALNGAGDTRFSMLVGLFVTWGVKVPVAVVGVHVLGLGVLGAWLGVAAELVVLAVLATSRVQGRAWLAHPA